MAEPTVQRYYRAPCPGCGAPVEFRSAQSSFAVCRFCQSTVVRQGDTLARIGKMAELFDDFSPLQLFASGRIGNQPFTLVGRLQYAYEGGRWTEWIASLDGGASAAGGEGGDPGGILSEDNGAFVFTRPIALQVPAPPPDALRVGATTAVNGQRYTVASKYEATLMSAQGELPHLPALGAPFTSVELRSDKGEVLSLDYDTDPPGAWLGAAVRLEDLQLSGLSDESAKEERGRSFNCPNCGAPVSVNLADSKSVTCESCHSIIDLTAGIGGELRHAEQDEPIRPLIARGSLGQLQGVHWQVVGYQHRMGAEAGDDEHFGWSEYLLYNRKRGFNFLVDSEEGWSVVKPTTGAPTLNDSQNTAKYLATTYKQLYAYNAETTYVAGEFYWQVERGYRSFNRDFANGAALLSMERSKNEVSWSSGRKIASADVAKAFKLDEKKDLFKRVDAAPLSSASNAGCGTIMLGIFLILIVVGVLNTCTDNSGGYRSSGGSYGGYSSGGFHK